MYAVPQSTIQNPGVFVREVSGLSPAPLDPATNYETQGGGYIQLMYEGLFQYTNNSATLLQPDLALNYTVSSNGLTYTFNLRTGVKFALQPGESVGQPFNAYVMQYSIDRAILMNDPAGPAWMIDQWIKGANTVLGTSDMNQSQAITFLSQQSIKALDANTLQITLTSPFGGFIQAIRFTVGSAISPKAIIDNEPSTYTAKQNDTYGMVSLASFFPGISNNTILSNLGLPNNYNIDNSGVVPSSPVSGQNAYVWLQYHSAGTGPYYLVDFVQGTKIDFSRNINWWNVNCFNQYSVDSITIKQVPTDATRVLDLQQGITDTGDIPFSLLSQFGVTANHTASTYSGVNSYIYNTLENEFIGMNLNDTLSPGQVVESSYSTYMKSNTTPLLKYTWNGANGKPQYASPNNPLTSILFREAIAYAFPTQTYINQALAGFAFRMQGAIPKGLLGYDSQLIINGDIPTYNLTMAKQLFNYVGWQGNIVFYYNQGSIARQISAQLLQQAIQSLNVNITVSVSAVSWNSYLTQVFNGGEALFQLGWAPDFADPHDYIVPYYLSGQTFSGPINYYNPAVNSLINSAATTTSPSTRAQLYNEIEQNATQDFPYIYLDQPQNVILARDWIQGLNRSQSDALNPMVNTLSYQYLAKTYAVVNWTAPYTVPVTTTSTTSTTSAASKKSATSTVATTNPTTSIKSTTSNTSTAVNSKSNTPSKSLITTSPSFQVVSTIGMLITITTIFIHKRKRV